MIIDYLAFFVKKNTIARSRTSGEARQREAPCGRETGSKEASKVGRISPVREQWLLSS